MKTLNPDELNSTDLYRLMISAIGPRPIALVSSISKNGSVNLSPFSFFNMFSASPPILVFAPTRRIRDDSEKDTYRNVKEIDEVVIHVVTETIVDQMALASHEFEPEVNEFKKAGFNEEKSIVVRPPRLAESPIAFECKVNQIIDLGLAGGAGSMVICQVKLIHIRKDLINEKNELDSSVLNLVGRLGGSWYCRAEKSSMFELGREPHIGMGFDQLPIQILKSEVLTGGEIACIASLNSLPDQKTVLNVLTENSLIEKVKSLSDINAKHLLAKTFIEKKQILIAACILVWK